MVKDINLWFPRNQTKAAEPNDWKRKPMPEKNTRIVFEKGYNEQEMEKIKWGFIPEQMEDKWFIFWKDNKLHFHRSWTGICIYIVNFQKEQNNKYSIKDAIINRDPEQYKSTDDEYDKKLILYIIDTLLIGKPSVFPSSNPDSPETALKKWALMGRGK